jgi:hypothetical protein
MMKLSFIVALAAASSRLVAGQSLPPLSYVGDDGDWDDGVTVSPESSWLLKIPSNDIHSRRPCLALSALTYPNSTPSMPVSETATMTMIVLEASPFETD